MKLTQRFAAILSVILAGVMICSLLLLKPETSWAQVSPKGEIPQVSIGDKIPANGYEIPANPSPLGERKEAIGEFAWKTFVALNWPANCQNGSPLTDKKIGEAPGEPRVWEFYNFPEDVFKPNGEKPNTKLVKPPTCPETKENDTAQQLQSHVQPQPLLSNLTEFGDDPTFELAAPSSRNDSCEGLEGVKPIICLAGDFVLVDRLGNYVISDARMNPAEVDQIVKKKWYSAAKLKEQGFNNPLKGTPFQLLCSSKVPNGAFPTNNNPKVPCTETSTDVNTSMGTIELKAAWMVLPDSDSGVPNMQLPDPSRYYTTKLKLSVKTPEDKEKETTVPVALIGFNLLHKTSQTGWVWSTFEHIDNVPPSTAPSTANPRGCDTPLPSKYPYNLYDPNFPDREKNKSLANPPYLWRDQFPHAVTENKENKGDIVAQTPSQITRQVCIPSFVNQLNTKWQEKLQDTVWQNYQLIGIQWLGSPYNPYEGGNLEFPRLINVALEPYPQEVKNQFGEKLGIDGFSCVGCHIKAKLPKSVGDIYSDFSFLMNNAK